MAGSNIDRVKLPRQIAGLDGDAPRFRIGHQRVHGIEQICIGRIARERPRLEMDRKIVFLEHPGLTAIFTAIETAVRADDK